MFEDVDKPVEPTKPTEEKSTVKKEKDWGPLRPIGRSIPPEEKTSLPPSPFTPASYPDILNAPETFEKKPSRKRFIILGIFILIIVLILIAGAIYVLKNLNKLSQNTNTNAVGNANAVIKNVNLNKNLNAETLTNAQNVNANANENVNLNANAAPTVTDSDNDGLEDKYETYFGTNAYKEDSDGDTYKDLDEIKNRYNPAGTDKLNSIHFQSFCQKLLAASVSENELSETDRANTCEVATEVYNLTNNLKSEIDQTAEQKLKNGCQVLDKKSENCEKAIWLIAVVFQGFDK